MNGPERPRVGPFLTFRGRGQFNGFTWSYYSDIKQDGIYDYLYVDDSIGRTGGQGGGGIARPEPELLTDRSRARILTTGEQDSAQGPAEPGQRLQPNAVNGVVAGPVTRVVVELSDGGTDEATLLPCAENDNVQFFVLVFPSGLHTKEIRAFDVHGNAADPFP